MQYTRIIRKLGKIRTTKKYRRKRYTIEGQNNTMEKSDELTQTNRGKV